jgi:hypothetical protein
VNDSSLPPGEAIRTSTVASRCGSNAALRTITRTGTTSPGETPGRTLTVIGSAAGSDSQRVVCLQNVS